MVAIDIQKISKWYGSFQVLKNCSTKVGKGEVVVVCGPSGSGKSTLIKTVNALEPFQSGTITVEGVSVGGGVDCSFIGSRMYSSGGGFVNRRSAEAKPPRAGFYAWTWFGKVRVKFVRTWPRGRRGCGTNQRRHPA